MSYERGDPLDHFLVLGELGEGGMGSVLAAVDPDLGRKVAIKLLPIDGEDGDSRSSRLFREAQALARLSHPNVVTVYEVGVVDDQVFIAMELVEGETLAAWLEAEPRSSEEIVRVFAAAGEGLAAAHDAGLVHRDVKPSNVLVGSDGRVRVVDFGLARRAPVTGDAADDEPGEALDVSGTHALDETLTQAGAVVGTPAYMSPEQFLGQAVDARSDQFSFCVALYEALSGARPFGGDTLAELSSEVTEGQVASIPGEREVPPRLRRLLGRGLQRLRRDRYPTMRALLDDLRPPPSRRPQLLAAAGVLSIAVAVGAGVWTQRTARDTRCTAAASHLEGVWDESTRRAMRAAFEATQRPYAGTTFDAIERELDAYTGAWVAMHEDACRATHVRGEQSAALLDRRMRCLGRRLDTLRALTTLMSADPGGEVIDGARRAVAQLPDVAACADTDALAAVEPLPAEPALAAEIASIREALDRAAALEAAGAYDEALAAARPLNERAAATEYLPVRAEVALVLGRAADRAGELDEAEAALREAALLAARARHDAGAARAWSYLLGVLSASASYDEALASIPAAEAAVERAGGGARLRARFLDHAGLVHSRSGDFETARALHEQAVALARDELGERSVAHVVALNHLGLDHWRLGDHDEARATFERKLELDRALFQPGHPMLAVTHNNLGLIAKEQGKLDEAIRHYQEALEIVATSVGPEHERATQPNENLGIVYGMRGEYDDARRHHETALAIREATFGEDHPEVARSLEGVGSIHWYEGDLETAASYYRRALEIRERGLPPDHPLTARTLNNLGGLTALSGDYEGALSYFERVLAVRERKLGHDHPDVARTLTDIGQTYVLQSRHADALGVLERALAIREARDSPPAQVAEVEMHLAQAAWEVGQRARATQLARHALHVFRDAGDRSAHERAALEAWLKERGLP